MFNQNWITSNPGWAKWLQPAPGDKFSARCTICKKTFSLSNMGRQAVESHSASKKHRNLITSDPAQTSLQMFQRRSVPPNLASSLPQQESSSQAESLPPPSSSRCESIATDYSGSDQQRLSTGGISQHLVKECVSKAEIKWALKSVTSHYSFHSAYDLPVIFREMFPDSEIAKTYSMGDSKLRYSVVYGLAPYFKSQLESSIRSSIYLVACFDEAFNKITRSKQMDLIYRFWDDRQNVVATRYSTSLFMGHATAEILLDKFKEALGVNPVDKILQISMDGPTTNWAFFNLFKKEVS